VFLDLRVGDARDEWRLLAVKAEAWLARVLARRPDVDRADLERLLTSLL